MKKQLTPFPNKATFDAIFSDCMEENTSSSKDVREWYDKMETAFEMYLAAVQEDMFQYAYKCGYNHGIKDATEKKEMTA